MKNIVVYSTPTCVFCGLAKDFFSEKGIKYVEYDVSSDLEKRKEMIDKSGQFGVPVILIGDEVIVGFDKDRISKLLNI